MDSLEVIMRPRIVLRALVTFLILGVATPALPQKDPDKKQGRGSQQQEARESKPARGQGKGHRQPRASRERQQRQQPQRQEASRQVPRRSDANRAQGRRRVEERSRPQETRRMQTTTPRRRDQVSTPSRRPTSIDRVRERVTSPRQVVRSPGRSGSTISGRHGTVWPRYRARNWRTEHRSWVQRGGYRGYRIPSSRFSLYFGPRHRFRLSSYDIVIYNSYPRFHYVNYWVTLLDPVPEYWAYDWYERDYVYLVELEDGYYLVNDSDPGVYLAVDIHLG
jgi:hypothetical protein